MSKVFCVVSIARQVEGEFILVNFEKAFTSAAKAQNYANQLAKTTVEHREVPELGPVLFYFERGVHEIDIEEDQTTVV